VVVKDGDTLTNIRKDLTYKEFLNARSRFNYEIHDALILIDHGTEDSTIHKILQDLEITAEAVELYIDEEEEALESF
jgi:hypothetical protein